MIIPENVRKCVVFIGYKMADGEFQLAGSAFFLGTNVEDGKVKKVCLVTAKHVIDGVHEKGINELFIRANTKNGEAVWLSCGSNDWRFHPTDKTADIAMLDAGIPENLDHLIIPENLCLTDSIIEEQSVGLGDEVFIVGLFRHHSGARKNIPIVRIGNLAAMSEEKILNAKKEMIDAYLIEARSIGGLSGSPVFLNLGTTRIINGQFKHANGLIFYLCGLIHGHYDVSNTKIDDNALDESGKNSIERVNTGIAIVTPIHKAIEMMKKSDS